MEDFPSAFATGEMANANEEVFDPFNIGVAPVTNADAANAKTTTNNNSNALSTDPATLDDKSIASSALPPRIIVKLKLQEEVSSVAHLSGENEGSSDVQIVGTVMAQVVSSDALKNIPFVLMSSTKNQEAVDFRPNDACSEKFVDIADGNSGAGLKIVSIPKETLEFVDVGTYRISQSMEHMPLLLEQKVARSKSMIQIAIQVRSKLSNPDDLYEFSMTVFIPKQVDGQSVSIATGDGVYDQWKRSITWQKQTLPKGQSFMVSAKCTVDETYKSPEDAPADEALNFPVMLRCQSKDQISSVDFQALEANGHPASVSSSIVGKSYRIVHRLN